MTTTVYAVRFDTRYLANTPELTTTDEFHRIRFFKDIVDCKFCMAGHGYYKGNFDIIPITLSIGE